VWRYARALAAPVLLWVLVAFGLRAPVRSWLRGEDNYDQAVLQEWLEEARGFRETLPEMVASYLDQARLLAEVQARSPAESRDQPVPDDGRPPQPPTLERLKAEESVAVKRGEIQEHLQALGNPPTRMYVGQLPLFPIIYRLQVSFDGHEPGTPAPITWDSELPSDSSQYQEMEHRIHPQARVYIRYQLHAYNKRQRIEQAHAARLRQLSVLAVAATVLGVGWMVLVQRREREREYQRLRAQQQVDQAERLLLQEEHRHAETERQLLEQRLATQAAERQALELKSQLYASISIMAGSYAHNIKNLLVRPNDLLRRCLEAERLSGDQKMMLHEVQETLGTVTERLQQILHTVRRDPSQSQPRVLDLNAVLGDLERTWSPLARDKWKLELALELNGGPGTGGLAERLWIAGDLSHLQQAVENLLFNARDATFEMRNHLRDAARRAEGLDAPARRQALIAAAAWRGRVVLRTGRRGDRVVLEVADNGIGMTEEVGRRCTETHFSTKRDNAIYEGHSTGMGLGLSFVVAILEHHRAALEVDSAPLRGTTFRIRFPASAPPADDTAPPAAGDANASATNNTTGTG
jgi:signal transduction histidine kinase